MKTLYYIPPGRENESGVIRHRIATFCPNSTEQPIVDALRGWTKYAEVYESKFDSSIGKDYVLGAAWESWGIALRELLCGDLGQLDAGILDSILYDNLKEQGFNPNLFEGEYRGDLL